MVQNCCNGVKILDLDEKLESSKSEYLVVAEKDNNFKMPMNQIANVVIEDLFGGGDGSGSTSGRLQAEIGEVYVSETPQASVRLEGTKLVFSFGIPEGKPGKDGKNGIDGKDGKDGKDGVSGNDGKDGISTRLVVAYQSNQDRINPPAKPHGGSWDPITNVITYPDGWSANDTNATDDYTWMSTATFSSEGQIVVDWSDPVCLTGENGRDGTDALSIEFAYYRTTTIEDVPQRPTGTTEDEAISQGWTDHPKGVTEELQCEWVISHTFQSDNTWSVWNEPTIWSKWGTVGKDGDGVEYIFKLTTTADSPGNITENDEDADEYVPDGWTDNPTGVDAEHPYEWVSMRTYKGATKKWSNYSVPAVWAKFGVNGKQGKNLEIRYQATANSDIKPELSTEERKKRIPNGWFSYMPEYSDENQAIWAIHGLVDNTDELYLDPYIPEEKRGWQGPYLLTATSGEPVGTIKLWSSTTQDPPKGWLFCFGNSVSKTNYPKLFDAIGYTYGGSNDIFNLPPLGGKFILAMNDKSGIGTTGGKDKITLTVQQLPKHSHTVLDWQTGTQHLGRFSVSNNVDSNVPKVQETSKVGEGKEIDIMPPYIKMPYIIKAF